MTTPHPNKAIWISSTNELSLRPIPEPYTPTGAQILVRVQYSGINPADIKHGLLLGLNNYPSGYEYAGQVIQTGPGAAARGFSPGDTVLGHNLAGRNKPIHHGAHQDVLIGEHFISRVPEGMPVRDAACVSIMVQTAADALFNQLGYPGCAILGPDGGEGRREAGLIWGGATNVGAAAIQIAKAVGLSPILTTASKHNHDTLLALGATHCFDYHDADVVEQIRAAVQEEGLSGGADHQTVFRGIFDTVGSRSSTDACESLCPAPAPAPAPTSGEGEAKATTILASTIPQPARPRWKLVLATRNVDFPAPKPGGGGIVMLPANPVWQDRIDRTFAWCLGHYGAGKGFVVPRVRVVGGGGGAEEAMSAMRFVAEGRSSLEKVVIEHPL